MAASKYTNLSKLFDDKNVGRCNDTLCKYTKNLSESGLKFVSYVGLRIN